jgi:hypothetical protein
LEALLPNRDKVWALELVGPAFDDKALASLPECQRMEILEAKDSRLSGSCWASLHRHPVLRVVRLGLAQGARFAFPPGARLPRLEHLVLSGLPASDFGCAELLKSVPALEDLRLETSGELVMEGDCPPTLNGLSLHAARLSGMLRLPKRMESVGVHLREGASEVVELLLAPVEELRNLDLADSIIPESLARTLAERRGLRFLSLVGTGVSPEALELIRAGHPGLRLFPRKPPPGVT